MVECNTQGSILQHLSPNDTDTGLYKPTARNKPVKAASTKQNHMWLFLQKKIRIPITNGCVKIPWSSLLSAPMAKNSGHFHCGECCGPGRWGSHPQLDGRCLAEGCQGDPWGWCPAGMSASSLPICRDLEVFFTFFSLEVWCFWCNMQIYTWSEDWIWNARWHFWLKGSWSI